MDWSIVILFVSAEHPGISGRINYIASIVISGWRLTLYGVVLPFSNISKEGLKLPKFFILDIVDISFVNVA